MIHKEIKVFSTNSVGSTGYRHREKMNLGPHLTQNLKCKTWKYTSSQKYVGENFCDLGRGKGFLELKKHKSQKKEIDRLNFLKI